MINTDNEEGFIRSLIIAVSAAAFTGVLVLAAVVTVLVSSNFNVLQWME